MNQQRNIYPWTLQEMLHPHLSEEPIPSWEDTAPSPVPVNSPRPSRYSVYANEIVAHLPHVHIVFDMAAFETLVLALEVLNFAYPDLGFTLSSNILPPLEHYLRNPKAEDYYTGPERQALTDARAQWVDELFDLEDEYGPAETINVTRLVGIALSTVSIITSHSNTPDSKARPLQGIVTRLLETTNSLLGPEAAQEIAEVFWHRLHSKLAWFKEG